MSRLEYFKQYADIQKYFAGVDARPKFVLAMKEYNCDRIRKVFSQHEIDVTLNDDGYSDVEIVIDDRYTGIWIDEWVFFGNNANDYEFLLQEITNYLHNI